MQQLNRIKGSRARPAWPANKTVLWLIPAALCGQEVEAQRCNNYKELEVSYLTGCVLRVEARVSEYHDCDAAIPGRLLLRVYRDGPSNPANPGERLCAERANGCDSPPGGIFRADIPIWDIASCNTASFFFVEAWLDPADSGGDQKCSVCGSCDECGDCGGGCIAGIPILPIPPGDDDGDGIDTCADNCPSEANHLQVNVDRDGKGDVCDPTRGDFNDDGQVDLADLEILRGCTSGACNAVPPTECTPLSFLRTRLYNEDHEDVDLLDWYAFQVFFMSE
jgi:hypothetical protein